MGDFRYLDPPPERYSGAPPNATHRAEKQVRQWADGVYGEMLERGLIDGETFKLIRQAAGIGSSMTSHVWYPLLNEAYAMLLNSTDAEMERGVVEGGPVTDLLKKLREALDWYNG